MLNHPPLRYRVPPFQQHMPKRSSPQLFSARRELPEGFPTPPRASIPLFFHSPTQAGLDQQRRAEQQASLSRQALCEWGRPRGRAGGRGCPLTAEVPTERLLPRLGYWFEGRWVCRCCRRRHSCTTPPRLYGPVARVFVAREAAQRDRRSSLSASFLSALENVLCSRNVAEMWSAFSS